jgi:hypothetical protein
MSSTVLPLNIDGAETGVDAAAVGPEGAEMPKTFKMVKCDKKNALTRAWHLGWPDYRSTLSPCKAKSGRWRRCGWIINLANGQM